MGFVDVITEDEKRERQKSNTGGTFKTVVERPPAGGFKPEEQEPLDFFESATMGKGQTKGVTPQDLLMTAGKLRPDHPAKAKLYEISALAQMIGQDAFTLPYNYFNQLLLNNPRAFIEEQGFKSPESSKFTPKNIPIPFTGGKKTSVTDIAAKASGVAGLVDFGRILNNPSVLNSTLPKGVNLPSQGFLKAGSGVTSKIANPLLKVGAETVRGAATAAPIGFAYAQKGKDFTDLDARAKGAKVSAIIGGLTTGAGTAIKEAIKSRGNAVNNIRGASNEYAKKEYGEYGKMLKKLGGDKSRIQVDDLLEEMTEELQRRTTMADGKPLPLNSKAERVFKKSLDKLMAKWANSTDGKVSVADVIEELQNIKDAGGNFKSPTANGKIAMDLQNKILNNIKGKIDSKLFAKGNARYAEFKNNMELLDKEVGIYQQNPKLTAKGEGFLKGQGFLGGKTVGADQRNSALKVIKDELGINLTNQQILNILERMPNSGAVKTLIVTGSLALANLASGGLLMKMVRGATRAGQTD